MKQLTDLKAVTLADGTPAYLKTEVDELYKELYEALDAALTEADFLGSKTYTKSLERSIMKLERRVEDLLEINALQEEEIMRIRRR